MSIVTPLEDDYNSTNCSCYTKITMNPDEQKQNYWETPESEQPEQITPEVEEVQQPNTGLDASDNPVTWTAQEYVHIDKSPLWFILFVIVVLGLISVDVFILKSWTFSALVVVMAVAIIIYTRRPPRALTYALSAKQAFMLVNVFTILKSSNLLD